MCELFGLCSNREVGVSFSWRGFIQRGRVNYHGWGIAFYRDNAAMIVKEPQPAPESPMAHFLRNIVRSRIVVSHVRLASRGVPSYANTHPFMRELYGRDWVFAHNGDVNIRDNREFRLKYYFPLGETDSEYAFCYIMDRLRGLRREVLDDVVEVSKVVWRMAKRIGDYGKFNFLLSDGGWLYAYMNRSGTLYYVLRHPPHQGYVNLVDEDFEVNLEEMKSGDEMATLIATKPLTNEKWIPFDVGKLLVFKNGDLILRVSSERRLDVPLSSVEKEVLRVVRSSPHSMKLADIADRVGMDVGEVAKVVRQLLCKNYLRQHSRDRVGPNHPEARFYTSKNIRPLIDKVLLKR